MPTTPHLGLPLMAAAQAQKHVTHNEALGRLDALVQCAVLDKDLATPPASPPEGARYIVGASPTGAWAGKAGFLVAWLGGEWVPTEPQPGFLAWVSDEASPYLRIAGGWAPLGDAIGALSNLARLGIGTAADAANPFAAKLNAALWTARGTGEGGSGDLRYVLNKEGASNVLSLLFQSGYSGRLELGLVGSDDLAVKVSADGAAWREALRVEAATGALDFLSAETGIAAAATVDLGAQPSRRVALTGAATISSFGTGRRKERLLRFTGAPVLVHGASLVLPGAANLTAAPGDTCLATSDADGAWMVRAYQRAAIAP